MRHLLLSIGLFSFFTSSSQYWIGPKVGFSRIDHIYQESTFERDSFNVPVDWNFNAGVAISYTATDRYAVYGEILYERIGRRVTDKGFGIGVDEDGEEFVIPDGQFVDSEMTNHFISAPVMLRITLGRVPFHYYINGGPRLSYWIGGKGKIFLEEFDEEHPLGPDGLDENENPLPVEYTITFNAEKALEAGNFSKAYVANPNRLQFGLTAGGGVFFDIQGGGRLQLDFRYTWVHSNMGLNGNDFLRFSTYRENFEHYHGIATVGVGYLIGYNSQLRRKGKSTSKESNNKKN